MKKILLVITFCLPSLALASWQMAGSPKPTSAGRPNKEIVNTPLQYSVNPKYTLHTHKGTLIHTVYFYLRHLGWHLEWKARKNIPLLTRASFAGHNVPDVLGSLFKYYPHLTVGYDIKHKVVTVNDKK